MLHGSVPFVTAKKLVLLCEVPCLNPGLDIGCPNTFCGFPQSLNTLASSYLNTQGLNNSCLKSPASTLVYLTFQSRELRSFSLNQLRNLSL